MAAHESTILVATDGSATAAAALAYAIDLANDLDAQLLVVSAWHELRGDFGIPLNPIVHDVEDIEREWTTTVAAEAVEQARAAGIEAEPIVRRGEPAAVIRAVARERRPRFIVLGSHGWGKVQTILFGSVSSGVLHDAPCPVLVVPKPHSVEAAPRPAVSAVAGET